MNNTIHRYSVPPDEEPDMLCTAGPSTLMYSDCDMKSSLTSDLRKAPRIIRWLDCSSSTPTPDGELNIQQETVYGMCCITFEGKSLLVTTDQWDSAIKSYSRESRELVWSKEGRLPGMGKEMGPWDITADGQGYLFVADESNKCIQKFCITGKYLGVLLKEGEQDLGELKHVQWNSATSSLVVVHQKGKEGHISVVNV